MYCAEYETEVALCKAFRWVESRDGKGKYYYSKAVLTNQKWAREYVKKYNLEEQYGSNIYSSIGDWQLLYISTHSHGFRGPPEGLLVFETNLKYYQVHINKIDRPNWNIKNSISQYNKGTRTKRSNGLYSNQYYVDFIYDVYKLYGGIR